MLSVINFNIQARDCQKKGIASWLEHKCLQGGLPIKMITIIIKQPLQSMSGTIICMEHTNYVNKAPRYVHYGPSEIKLMGRYSYYE